MITYTTGNLLTANAQALVNTVNTEGVMGKGIALHFKERFAENYAAYRTACKNGTVRVGEMFVTELHELAGPKWIVNFPTKTSWRKPSELRYIQDGLIALVKLIEQLGIRSIALPPLGCGNGGLDWNVVKPMIEAALGELDGLDVLVFEPSGPQAAIKAKVGTDQLTPARTLILEAIRRYGILDGACSLIQIQKLAYFMTRVCAGMGLDSPFKLVFKPNIYGPYADSLRPAVRNLEGSFLTCDKPIADASASDLVYLDDSRIDRFKAHLNTPEMRVWNAMLKRACSVWEGFETPFDIELLATVDWLQNQSNTVLSVPELMQGIRNWPHANGAKRKAELFDARVVGIARAHLEKFSDLLYGHGSNLASMH
jgi:O-acetyl-ADP-ribose deacetylase (regulator of RNase III)